jgi:hypothetical protein
LLFVATSWEIVTDNREDTTDNWDDVTVEGGCAPTTLCDLVDWDSRLAGISTTL